jgi:RNA polymerase sigma-70 factor (ECF subfamily)
MSKNLPRITPEEIKTIKDAQAGSMKAFNRIFYRYKPFVENLLFQYLKDMDESKDLTNIVFLKVYDKLSKFTAYDSFGGWLRILAKNTAVDYLRTISNKTSVSVDNKDKKLQLPDVDGDDEISVTNKMTYDYLISLIDTLPPSYRESCRLFYVENMTVAQRADALKIPQGTVKSNLFRMRKHFQKLKL